MTLGNLGAAIVMGIGLYVGYRLAVFLLAAL